MINFMQNVGLIPLDQCDRDKLLAWRNDWRIYRSCRQRDILTEREHNLWYARETEQNSENKMYGIVDAEDRDLIGVCGLTNIDWINRRAEFSLYIAPEFQRDGFGKEALKTLISHGFSTFGFNSIWGESFEDNPAVCLFLKLGFGRDGIRRQFYFREGRFINAHLFSILKSEWETNPEFDDARTQVWSSI